MKICARCDKPMSDANAESLDKTSDSGPGMTLYVHHYLCKKPKTQTSPASRERLIREG